MSAARPIIVGGGIAGLSAAYDLTHAGFEPVLLEPGRLGGVIQTETVDGCVIEAGPDSFLSAKPAGLELIRELGLSADVIGSNDSSRVTYVVRGGKLVPLPDGLMMMVPTRIWPVVSTPLLSWPAKIRMGLEFFHSSGRKTGDRSVAEFIRQHYGQEAVDYLVEPLLSGVYGGDVEQLSVNSVLARFTELEAKYGSLTRGVLAARRNAPAGRTSPPLFQTLKGGLGQLVAALTRAIDGQMTVVPEAALTVDRIPNGYAVRTATQTLESPHVIVATPAWAAGALLRTLDAELSDSLSAVPYSSSMTLAIGLDRAGCGPLPPGFGFLIPSRERRMLVACTFVGAKFPYRVPEGRIVLRCFLGGAGKEAVLDLDDGAILSAVLDELETLLGWRPKPAFTRIARWRRSMAQYVTGHAARVAGIEQRLKDLPGLHLAGNAYDGIGVPDCIRLGRAAARSVAAAR